MKRVLLLTLTLLMFSVLLNSDIITFEEQQGSKTNHVQGEIWLYNHFLNIWQPAPPGQNLGFVLNPIPGSGAPQIYQFNVYSQYTGGYYYNFTTIPDPFTIDDYCEVIVKFRGTDYYADFDGAAWIDIWWVQAY
ncbi:MAG: hypothetical protein K0B81_01135 [Candidatus Cloacimonetes bacterium]|nr:hypothetical protein [Candidatus Cloacimonadota bacterium]